MHQVLQIYRQHQFLILYIHIPWVVLHLVIHAICHMMCILHCLGNMSLSNNQGHVQYGMI